MKLLRIERQGEKVKRIGLLSEFSLWPEREKHQKIFKYPSLPLLQSLWLSEGLRLHSTKCLFVPTRMLTYSHTRLTFPSDPVKRLLTDRES